MRVVFLSPLGLALALAAVVPLLALLVGRRRGDRVRGRLGLGPLPSSRLVVPLAALAAAALLLGLAAAQPVLERNASRVVRSDAEAYVVFDVSRSMLARSDPDGRTRLARAKAAAERLRAAMPTIPVGVASFTDRLLPHLFPSGDEAVFRATVERAVGIERPPPRSSFLTNATSLDSLAAVPSQRFFSPGAKKRVLVVMTDGESQSVNVARIAKQLKREPAIGTVFLQFWGEDERVYTRGAAEAQYRPDPSARVSLERLASALPAPVYSEGELSSARQKAVSLVGSGPTVVEGSRTSRWALAPYLAAFALLPLALLLWRRDR